MKLEVKEDYTQVVILDITGIYAQIYDHGYFNKESIANIKNKYTDMKRWRVLVIN